jgi:uncharacterized membrane protein
MDKNRLEAFSDGVMAIAITLLILEIRVPEVEEGGLARALAAQWPSYAAYLVSFAVIGIIWVNHHRILAYVAQVDRPLLFLNLLLLIFVAAIPFPTALLARYIEAGWPDANVAAAVYSGGAIGVAISFQLLWRWIVRDARLLHAHFDVQVLRGFTRRFSLGLIVYPIAFALSFWSAPLTLALHGLVAVFYVFDQVSQRGGIDEAAP